MYNQPQASEYNLATTWVPHTGSPSREKTKVPRGQEILAPASEESGVTEKRLVHSCSLWPDFLQGGRWGAFHVPGCTEGLRVFV